MVILYGDRITEAMNYLVNETDRRRTLQNEHNIKNNIIPESVYKSIDEIMISTAVADSTQDDEFVVNSHIGDQLPDGEKEMILIELRKSMMKAAEKLEFEKAAKIRDEIEIFEKETGIKVTNLDRFTAMTPISVSSTRSPNLSYIFKVDISEKEYDNRQPHDNEIYSVERFAINDLAKKMASGEIYVSLTLSLIHISEPTRPERIWCVGVLV